MRTGHALIGVMVACASGCAPGPKHEPVWQVGERVRGGLGCFELHGPMGLLDEPYIGASSLVRLDTVWALDSRDTNHGWPFVRTTPIDTLGRALDSLPVGSGPGWGYSRDSLHISFGSGRAGATLILALPHVGGDTIRGRVSNQYPLDSSDVALAWAARLPSCPGRAKAS